MVRAAGARFCMRGAGPTIFWKSDSRRRARTTSSPSTNARFWRPDLQARYAAAWAIAETLKPAGKPLDIQTTATDSGLDIDVRGSGTLSAERLTALARVAEAHSLARLTRHGELVAQRAQPLLQVGRAKVPLPPGAFLQATAEGEATLARLVIEHVGKAKHVADLFAGIGTFALRLAERARVSAADSDADAIKALERAAATTSGLKPVDAVQRDLFRRPFVASELKAFRRCRVRSAAPGRRSASARASQKCGAACGRSFV